MTNLVKGDMNARMWMVICLLFGLVSGATGVAQEEEAPKNLALSALGAQARSWEPGVRESPEHEPSRVNDGSLHTYWAVRAEDLPADIGIEWPKPQEISSVIVRYFDGRMVGGPAMARTQQWAQLFELQSRWGIAQIKAGADAVWLGDCNAFSGLLSPTQYHEFAAEPCRKVIQAIQSAGGMVFLHNSEVSIPHLELQCRLKPDVVSVGPAADLEAVLDVARGKTCIMGNIDPIEDLLRGTRQQVEKEVERVMSIGRAGTGFMLDSGEAVPRDAPAENMHAIMRRSHELAVLQDPNCF